MASSDEPGSASPDERRVAEWLAGLEMGQYAAALAKNEITLATLALLSDDDLLECGVEALGHRKVILAAIQKLATHAAASPPPAAPKPAPAADFPTPPAEAVSPMRLRSQCLTLGERGKTGINLAIDGTRLSRPPAVMRCPQLQAVKSPAPAGSPTRRAGARGYR